VNTGSGIDPRPPSWSAALFVLALAGAACDVTRGTAAPNSAPPPMLTAVGPIAGPDKHGPTAPNPYSGDKTGMAEGRQLFNRMNCAGCHGDHGGGGMGPSLRDVDWMYGATDAQIFKSVAEGRARGMPAWGTKMNDDQIWKIVAYVKAFRTRDEISPPS
jgi:cytochrome c oxidase cbb3-type subunit 3